VSAAGGLAVPALAALAAAGTFGVAAALQHQQAGLARPTRGLSLGLLADVARRPRWLAGVALATAAYGLQAIALAYGPLTLVAPIVAADLLVALPLAARWSRRPLRPRDWAGCLLVAIGVSVFLAAAPPSGERRTAPAGDWFMVLGLVALIVLAALAISRGRLPARASVKPVGTGRASTGRGGWFRAGALAAAAGVVFGLTAAVTASFTTALRADGLRSVLAHWQPWALVVLGLTGILLSTAAFQAGSLAASLPVIDTVEPVSGVIIGAMLFDERLATSPAGLVAQLGAAAVAATGIAVLGPSLAAVQAASGPAPADPALAHLAAIEPHSARAAPGTPADLDATSATAIPTKPVIPNESEISSTPMTPGTPEVPAARTVPAGARPTRRAAGSAASGPYRNEGVCRTNGLGPPARTAALGVVRARGGPTECDLLEPEGPPITTEDRADQLPL
jgi:drug/metabolite transporter (DMT)-like permease